MTQRHQENFPVASWLIPRSMRKPVIALYHFARGADDLADTPSIPSEEARQELLAVDAMLAGTHPPTNAPDWAKPYLYYCEQGCFPPEQGRRLLSAFIGDLDGHRCPHWEAALDYCLYSAVPVGISYMQLAGETPPERPLIAICTCLQLINHVQDIWEDYTTLGRIYLPSDWMEKFGVTETMLSSNQSSPQVRQWVNEILDAIAPLLQEANQLPAALKNKQLKIEICWILTIMEALCVKLYRQDPLANHVRLSTYEKLVCLVRAIGKMKVSISDDQ